MQRVLPCVGGWFGFCLLSLLSLSPSSSEENTFSAESRVTVVLVYNQRLTGQFDMFSLLESTQFS